MMKFKSSHKHFVEESIFTTATQNPFLKVSLIVHTTVEDDIKASAINAFCFECFLKAFETLFDFPQCFGNFPVDESSEVLRSSEDGKVLQSNSTRNYCIGRNSNELRNSYLCECRKTMTERNSFFTDPYRISV